MDCQCPHCAASGKSVQTMEAFMAHVAAFELPPGMPAINGICRSLLRARDSEGKEVGCAYIPA